jgi:hypothetical protein
MDTHDRLMSWLFKERERIAAEIDLLSSGRGRRMATRGRRMLDVTGEALKDLQRRMQEVDALIGHVAGPP